MVPARVPGLPAVETPAGPRAIALAPAAGVIGENREERLAPGIPPFEHDLVDTVAIDVEVIDEAAVLGRRGGSVHGVREARLVATCLVAVSDREDVRRLPLGAARHLGARIDVGGNDGGGPGGT